MTDRLLKRLKANGVVAVGFVNESKLFREGEVDERIAILKSWLEAGHELGNHTFSHPSLHTTPLAEFKEDVIRGETVTRALASSTRSSARYFRHPFLRTGPTREVRLEFERFLADRGYVVAPVTLDNSDYMFNTAYVRAADKGDSELRRRIAASYIQYMASMLDFYESVSTQLFGRDIAHVLLLHANELNADTFDDLAGLFRRRGYGFVTLAEALKDKAYSEADNYAGPFGMSWLHRWAFSRGLQMRLREEPEPPDFIRKLFSSAQ
jgi:peptidoglycan/xylan/chitin deacetylase (PgdA/CDA1 family)